MGGWSPKRAPSVHDRSSVTVDTGMNTSPQNRTDRRAPRYLICTCRPCRSALADAKRLDALTTEYLALMTEAPPPEGL